MSEPGIISAIGSGLASLSLFGDGSGQGFKNIGRILGGIQADIRRQAKPEPTREPTRPISETPILQPTIFAIQRAAVCDWLADVQGRTSREVCDDPGQQSNIDALVECLVERGSLGEPESDIEECADLTADEERSRRIREGLPEFIGLTIPGVFRGPVRVPFPGPRRRGTGSPPVVRRRDRPSPPTPEIGPIGGGPSRIPNFPMDTTPPPVEFPPLGEPLPPELEEIPLETLPERLPTPTPTELPGLFPVKLPAIARPRAVPRTRTPQTVPAIPAPLPSPAPVPVPAPAPRFPGVLVGTVVGAGLTSILRGRVPSATSEPRRPPQRTPEPPVPAPPSPVLQPTSLLQEQAQASRRERERERCEKRRRKNRRICKEGFFRERRKDTKFTWWRKYDCLTGETILER